MIKKYNFNISFKWFDFWVGLFWDSKAKALYICLLPMLPIKLWTTTHKACTKCGQPMHKAAVWVGDGWGLYWDCDDHPGEDEDEIPWEMDLAGVDRVSGSDLERMGYRII